MNVQRLNPAILAIMCEQIGNLFPTDNSVDYYLAPILKWMTEEWKRIKKLIADMIVDVAMGKSVMLEAAPEIWFPSGKQNLIWQSARGLLGGMQKELKSKVNDAKRQARIDANPAGIFDASDTTPVMLKLSREGLEEVISSLDYQVGFMDDFTKSTRERVLGLTRARYGTFTELRDHADRAFRLDRDKTLGLFKSDVQGLAQRVIDGTLDVDGFVNQMQSSIGNYYERLYMQGKNVTSLQDWERQLIRGQVQGQRPYLDNFADYIRNKQALGQELTTRVTWRAGLYAERGSAMFEFGVMSAWPDDILIDWKMQPAEHCTTCPVYEANSPYTKDTLPGFPGEGFRLTQCGTNCNCIIQPSDLYVWKPVEEVPIGLETPVEPISERYRFGISDKNTALLNEECDKYTIALDMDNKRETFGESKTRIAKNLSARLQSSDDFMLSAMRNADSKDLSELSLVFKQRYKDLNVDVFKAPFAEVRTAIGKMAPADQKKVTELFNKMGEKLSSDWVKSWAASSADNNPVSLAIQRAVSEEFKVFGVTEHLETALANPNVNMIYEKQGKAMREFVRAQYDITQEFLKDTTHVTLYRGVQVSEELSRKMGIEALDKVVTNMDVMMQPISSFSVDPIWAKEFAHSSEGQFQSMILQSSVPKERILSTCQTGFGCKIEGEMVVLGGKEKAKVLIVKNSYDLEKISVTRKFGEPIGEW